MPLFAILLAFLLVVPAALFADEPDSLAQEPAFESIALPRQSAYNGGKGLTFGLGVGVFDPAHDCDCMGSWQVQMEYFYLDWLSGGGNVRFFGGNLDNDEMVVYQRFSLHLRTHAVFNSLDLYMGPIFGLENTNISEFRDQVTHRSDHGKRVAWFDSESEPDSTKSQEDCVRNFAMEGFSVGLSFGAGYNVSRLFGVTLGSLVEYNFRKDFLVSVIPGVAFNLREVWPWAKRSLRSTWISFEIGGQKAFNRDVEDWANSYFLGFLVGA